MTLQERINEAREAVESPGKFENESPMAYILWDMVLNGYSDDDVSAGDQSFARIGRRVVTESSGGFVYYDKYDTEAEAITAMETVHRIEAREYEEYE